MKLQTNKLYSCVWTNTDNKAMNSYELRSAVNKLSFFSELMGYTDSDILAINKLNINEEHTAEYGNHTIIRVK